MSDSYMRTPVIIAAIGLIGFGLLLWSTSNKAATPSIKDVAPVAGAVWTKGNPDAKVVLTEFGDFQCPACAGYEPTVEAIVAKYGHQIKFEFYHFPLPMHPNAIVAAKAAEAAGAQGKFWEMHNLLYEKQTDWANMSDPKEKLIGYAHDLGLDQARFTTDIDSAELLGRVSGGVSFGNEKHVNYTPFFLLNGERLENPQTADEFNKVIEKALSDAGTPYVPPVEEKTQPVPTE